MTLQMSLLVVKVEQIGQFLNRDQENLRSVVEVRNEMMKQMKDKSLLKALNKIQIYFRHNVPKKMLTKSFKLLFQMLF
jgi:hypothetical protein